MVAALILHVAAAYALLSWSLPLAPPSAPPAAILVELVARPVPVMAPAAAAAPVSQIDPLPEAAAPARLLPPPEKPRPKAAAVRAPPHRIKPAPRPEPPSDAVSVAAASPAPAAASVIPSNALPDFETRLYAYLNQYKRYPRAARSRGEQGTAYLRFTMDRQGKILAADLERSSGHDLLDHEVMAMLQRAAPLPAIPAGIAQSPLKIVIPVEFALR